MLAFDCCREECGIAEDVEHVLGSRNKQSLALMHLHAIDVGIAMQTNRDDKRIAVEIDLLSMLHHNTIDREIRTFDEWSHRQSAVVRRAILGIDLKIDGIFG